MYLVDIPKDDDLTTSLGSLSAAQGRVLHNSFGEGIFPSTLHNVLEITMLTVT